MYDLGREPIAAVADFLHTLGYSAYVHPTSCRRRDKARRRVQPRRASIASSRDEAIARKLQVMDTAAFALARDNGIPIDVFSVDESAAIPSALLGKRRATYVMP